MDQDISLQKQARKKKAKTKKAYHSYDAEYQFPPPMVFRNQSPIPDWARISTFFRNMSTPGIPIKDIMDKLIAEREEARAKETSGPKYSGKKQAKGLSEADKIRRQATITREQQAANGDITRLSQGNAPDTVLVNSSTGKLARNIKLICHHWDNERRGEALDVWLDLGYDARGLTALVASEDDFVEVDGNFIFPELLEDVYEQAAPTLKAFLKWYRAEEEKDIAKFQLEDMGDRLIPLNHNLFHSHRCGPSVPAR